MNDFIETQEYYSNLFKGCAILTKDDVTKEIADLGNKYKRTSWAAFATYLNRMKSALEASTLNEERRSWVMESLNPQIREYTYYQNIPELRPYINEGDRSELVRRRLALEHNGFYNNEEDLWKEDEAQGKVADWRERRAAALEATIFKIQILDDRLAKPPDTVAQSTPAPVVKVEDQQHAATTNQAREVSVQLNTLFRLGFTVQHCDELMKKVGVGLGYKRLPNLNAKIWALLFVLEDYNLLSCSPAEAAEVAGRHYAHRMAEKPSKVKRSTSYNEARNILSNQLRDGIANKKYGPALR